jgi:hypothetical protein
MMVEGVRNAGELGALEHQGGRAGAGVMPPGYQRNQMQRYSQYSMPNMDIGKSNLMKWAAI